MYLLLNSLFRNSPATFSSVEEQNSFIRHCDRGNELLEITEHDQEQPLKQHYFIPSNLVHTISKAYDRLPPLPCQPSSFRHRSPSQDRLHLNVLNSDPEATASDDDSLDDTS